VNKIALVRTPSPLLDNGVVSHIEKSEINMTAAIDQWKQYCEALRDQNWRVVTCPNPNTANDYADSVFIEDCIVMYKDLLSGKSCAVITRPGHPERRNETDHLEDFLKHSSAVNEVYKISDPGTLDGGDVLKVGSTVYVGDSDRTNSQGIEQFANILRPYGAAVVSVPLNKVLHLKSAATALPCGTIIAWKDALDEEAINIFKRTGSKNIIFSPEEHGSHVILLDEQTLLMSHQAPLTAAMLRSPPYNLKVVTVNIDEYIKLEGCVTCLSVRIR
ncbi:unnamed protein product, partial [Ectocarpus fasciculatus]